MQRGGTDIIELGVPFSNPTTDGPTHPKGARARHVERQAHDPRGHARPGERGTRARPHHPDRAHGLLDPVHGLWRALKHWEIAAVDCLRVFVLGLIYIRLIF